MSTAQDSGYKITSVISHGVDLEKCRMSTASLPVGPWLTYWRYWNGDGNIELQPCIGHPIKAWGKPERSCHRHCHPCRGSSDHLFHISTYDKDYGRAGSFTATRGYVWWSGRIVPFRFIWLTFYHFFSVYAACYIWDLQVVEHVSDWLSLSKEITKSTSCNEIDLTRSATEAPGLDSVFCMDTLTDCVLGCG